MQRMHAVSAVSLTDQADFTGPPGTPPSAGVEAAMGSGLPQVSLQASAKTGQFGGHMITGHGLM